MATRLRKPGRLRLAKQKRAARNAEKYIVEHYFPRQLEARVRKQLPELDDLGWLRVERGLREWFVCCAWRGEAMLGMPSRAVDEAWHEYILDSRSYVIFCENAFGEYLHHSPDEVIEAPMANLIANTVHAWDRSQMGQSGESVLWDFDRELGIERPFAGASGVQLSAARSRIPTPFGSPMIGCGGGGSAYGVGEAAPDVGGGDGGGGGGCGGGCGGGGGG